MKDSIKVGILDDHLTIINGYKFNFQSREEIEVVWEAEYYSQVEPLLDQHPTDVIIMDVSVDNAPNDHHEFPILNAILSLIKKFPELNILVISMHNRHALVNHIIRAGAKGYILKEDRESHNELPNIIHLIAQGGTFISPSVRTEQEPEDQSSPKLTPRMLEALSISAAAPSKTTEEIAVQMDIAPSTVRNLLSHSYARLSVPNISSAIAKAKMLGLITPDK
ncbi:response regulator [Chloroflexota bacterium]